MGSGRPTRRGAEYLTFNLRCEPIDGVAALGAGLVRTDLANSLKDFDRDALLARPARNPRTVAAPSQMLSAICGSLASSSLASMVRTSGRAYERSIGWCAEALAAGAARSPAVGSVAQGPHCACPRCRAGPARLGGDRRPSPSCQRWTESLLQTSRPSNNATYRHPAGRDPRRRVGRVATTPLKAIPARGIFDSLKAG
jgi:hypothetical protein